MKRTVKISRVVACIAVSLYTVFTCYLCGQMAYYYCGKIVVENGAYYNASSMTREAVPYIVVAAVLILLGVASVVLLFRRGWLTACLSGAAAVVSAILGMCINTKLAEVIFAKYTLGMMTDLRWLPFKLMTALLCILAAAVYVTLYLISHHRQTTRC